MKNFAFPYSEKMYILRIAVAIVSSLLKEIGDATVSVLPGFSFLLVCL